MHEHIQCEHDIKYCRVCDVCYCEKCKKQWCSSYTISYPQTVTLVGDGTYSGIKIKASNHTHGKDLE